MLGLTCGTPPKRAIMRAISSALRLSSDATRRPEKFGLSVLIRFMLLAAGSGQKGGHLAEEFEQKETKVTKGEF